MPSTPSRQPLAHAFTLCPSFRLPAGRARPTDPQAALPAPSNSTTESRIRPAPDSDAARNQTRHTQHAQEPATSSVHKSTTVVTTNSPTPQLQAPKPPSLTPPSFHSLHQTAPTTDTSQPDAARRAGGARLGRCACLRAAVRPHRRGQCRVRSSLQVTTLQVASDKLQARGATDQGPRSLLACNLNLVTRNYPTRVSSARPKCAE